MWYHIIAYLFYHWLKVTPLNIHFEKYKNHCHNSLLLCSSLSCAYNDRPVRSGNIRDVLSDMIHDTWYRVQISFANIYAPVVVRTSPLVEHSRHGYVYEWGGRYPAHHTSTKISAYSLVVTDRQTAEFLQGRGHFGPQRMQNLLLLFSLGVSHPVT